MWTRRSPPCRDRSSWCRSAMRAMRSMPRMRAGVRSTTRSTAPTPFRETARGRSEGYDPDAAGRSSPGRAASSTMPCRSRPARMRDVTAYRSRTARSSSASATARTSDSRTRAVRRLSGRAGRADGDPAAATTASTSRSSSTARTRSAATIPPASPTSCSRRRSPPSWICEDSIAAVDAADKVAAYRNWLGLMQGTSPRVSTRAAGPSTRRLNRGPRLHRARRRRRSRCPGRSLMLVRNVGHLMTTDAVLDRDGSAVPEGILDAAITSLIALHDLKRAARRATAARGSIYIVKPKMHGPEEVAFANRPLRRGRGRARPARATRIKLGLMDEERRTTVNLKECIRAAKSTRLLHQHRLPRPHRRRDPHRHGGGADGPQGRHARQPWLKAYEDWNVDIGLACGLPGHAQIGKGMWAMPDLMAAMLEQKIGASQGRRQHRVGPLPHRRDAARDSLSPGRLSPRSRRQLASRAARRLTTF